MPAAEAPGAINKNIAPASPTGNNNETNKIITFKCKKKHFPGLITGYLDSDVFFEYNNSDQKDLNIFKRNTNDLAPFIYQGDNY